MLHYMSANAEKQRAHYAMKQEIAREHEVTSVEYVRC